MNSPNDAVPGALSPVREAGELRVTVVICTRNRSAHLRHCLQAVSALKPPADAVLVVDNSAGDKETEIVAREFHARYLVEDKIGLSQARNRGMVESNTEIVAYLDDDAEPDKHWLEYLLPPFADSRVASVSGWTTLPEMAGSACKNEPPRLLSNQDPQWFEIASFGGLGLGSNMALRRSVCEGIAIFHLQLGLGTPIGMGEEHYAFVSLLSRGYWAVHVPGAIVTHPASEEDVGQQAASSIAYWLMLFAEFPAHRADLLRFLWWRLRKKTLTWPRDPQTPGRVINSGWRVYMRSICCGGWLFWRTIIHR